MSATGPRFLKPDRSPCTCRSWRHGGHPVSHAEIYRRAFGTSYSARDARRTYYHIDRPRSRLSPFGLLIRTVIDHGYLLLRGPLGPRAV